MLPLPNRLAEPIADMGFGHVVRGNPRVVVDFAPELSDVEAAGSRTGAYGDDHGYELPEVLIACRSRLEQKLLVAAAITSSSASVLIRCRVGQLFDPRRRSQPWLAHRRV